MVIESVVIDRFNRETLLAVKLKWFQEINGGIIGFMEA